MLLRKLSRFVVAAAATGMVVLGGSNRAAADLLIALAEDGGAYSVVATSSSPLQSANSVGFNGKFGDFTISIDTTSSNYPPGSQAGVFLQTTTNSTLDPTLSSTATHTLHVLAEIIPSGSTSISPLQSIPIPSGPVLPLNSQLATTGSAAFFGSGSSVTFTSTVNGNNYGPISLTTTPASTQMNFTDGPSPYTLTNTTDIKLVGGGSSVGSTGTSTVTAVPEPATTAMILGGLPVLGLVWARRRRQRA